MEAQRDKKNDPLANEDLLEVQKQLKIHFGEEQTRMITEEYAKNQLLGDLHRIIWLVSKKGVGFSELSLSSATG